MKRRLAVHPWERADERRIPAARASPSGEGAPSGSDGGELPSEEEDNRAETWGDRRVMTEDECAQEFIDLLDSMRHSGHLSSKLFCNLCWWAAGFTMNPVIHKYAKAPGAPSGHYQPFLDQKFGTIPKKHTMYTFDVPGHRRHDLQRTLCNVPVNPAHEQLALELKADPSVQLKLWEAVHEDKLPPSYHSHPVVLSARAAGKLALPLALFLDGVPYSHTDGVLGVWLLNIVSGKRHLVVVLRKRIICKCGCRGWCSYDALFRMLHWMFDCMATAKFPTQRHDGCPWRAEDIERATLAGHDMLPMPAVLLYIKGDWAEYASTFGFPSWASISRPCIFCATSKEEMFDVAGLSPISFPHRENTDLDYDEAAKRCEIHVEMSAVLHREILPYLRFDKRKDGSRGLALTKDFPSAGLLADDRLEPSAALPDIGKFEELSSFPTRVTFWRMSRQSLVLHRCPLWDEQLGITPTRSLTIDSLHTWHLGVVAEFSKIAVWALLDSTEWTSTASTAQERGEVAMLILRSELKQFCQQCTEDLTPPHDFTPKMLGTAKHPKLKLSGAETWALLQFLKQALVKYAAKVEKSGILIEAAGLLDRIHRISKQTSGKVPPALQQDRNNKYIYKYVLYRL